MKKLVFILVMLISGISFSQVGISAGASMLAPVKLGVHPYGGFHIGVEIPRDDQLSLYGRFTHHFKQHSDFTGSIYVTPIDPIANPIYPNVSYTPSMNYNMIEGGMRYYLGDGFDYGWAAYGGTNLMLIINRVKANYEAFDEAKYQLDINSRVDGTIFNLGAGLGGGVKYSDARLGTFYFDLNLNYVIFAYPSSANVNSSLYSPLIFNFNLGYRRDIIWNR